MVVVVRARGGGGLFFICYDSVVDPVHQRAGRAGVLPDDVLSSGVALAHHDRARLDLVQAGAGRDAPGACSGADPARQSHRQQAEEQECGNLRQNLDHFNGFWGSRPLFIYISPHTRARAHGDVVFFVPTPSGH